MSHYISTEALVINKRNHKDNNLRITLLSPTLGKIHCSAIGVKNIKSSRLGALQLGNIIKCSLFSKNDQYWISEAKATISFLNTDKSLTQINLLFYFLEIINYFIAENQSSPIIFQTTKNIIKAVNLNQFHLLIKYEIDFLQQLGFGVPPEISESFAQEKYIACQNLLKKYLESIIEKPLISNKLFK